MKKDEKRCEEEGETEREEWEGEEKGETRDEETERKRKGATFEVSRSFHRCEGGGTRSSVGVGASLSSVDGNQIVFLWPSVGLTGVIALLQCRHAPSAGSYLAAGAWVMRRKWRGGNSIDSGLSRVGRLDTTGLRMGSLCVGRGGVLIAPPIAFSWRAVAVSAAIQRNNPKQQKTNKIKLTQ